MRRLKQSWQLYLLRREAERIRHSFVECDGSEAAINLIAARNVENMFAIDQIKTDRLLRLADKYDVPIPTMLLRGNRNEFWTQSPLDRNVKVLNETARSVLRAEIWKVQTTIWERRTRWVPLLAGVTGVLGTAIGVMVTIQKWF